MEAKKLILKKSLMNSLMNLLAGGMDKILLIVAVEKPNTKCSHQHRDFGLKKTCGYKK